MIDFHSHVLPSVDDGAQSIDDANALVTALGSQKVTDIVCTPHFYPDQTSIDRFLMKRDYAFSQLCGSISSGTGSGSESEHLNKKIRLHLGAEVYLNEFLLICSDPSELCIKGTDLLLLEMPFSSKWPSQYRKIIHRLVERHNITPIIAHAERYPYVIRHSTAILKELIDSGCVIQANCDSFLDSALKKKVLKWLDCGLIHVLGTDCHNSVTRPPHMAQARDVILRELGAQALQRIDNWTLGTVLAVAEPKPI